MASAGDPPLEQPGRLLDSFLGSIFCQMNRLDAEQGRSEALQAVRLAPERVVLKIPARSDLYGLAATLVGGGVACAITAVYSPGQALLAAKVGAEWMIPYVDRASRLLDGGEA